jgi:hypothetical protein
LCPKRAPDGTRPWQAAHERRVALYRYYPAHLAPTSPDRADQYAPMHAELSPLARAVLTPPWYPMAASFGLGSGRPDIIALLLESLGDGEAPPVAAAAGGKGARL